MLHSVAQRGDTGRLTRISVAKFSTLIGRTPVLETAIRIVVIAAWRHAWHCFAIHQQPGEFFG